MAAKKRAGAAAKPEAHVALLRGVNVAGKNMLPMPALITLFSELGARDVTTYIQSGNVLFHASPSVAASLPAKVTARIEERFELRVPVIVRSRAELGSAIERNPFVERGEDEGALHVMFLADAPSARAIAALDANRSPGDSFEALGREIYLCCPNGIGRSKLTNAYFDRALDTTSTLRNWRTTRKLLELLESPVS